MNKKQCAFLALMAVAALPVQSMDRDNFTKKSIYNLVDIVVDLVQEKNKNDFEENRNRNRNQHQYSGYNPAQQNKKNQSNCYENKSLEEIHLQLKEKHDHIKSELRSSHNNFKTKVNPNYKKMKFFTITQNEKIGELKKSLEQKNKIPEDIVNWHLTKIAKKDKANFILNYWITESPTNPQTKSIDVALICAVEHARLDNIKVLQSRASQDMLTLAFLDASKKSENLHVLNALGAPTKIDPKLYYLIKDIRDYKFDQNFNSWMSKDKEIEQPHQHNTQYFSQQQTPSFQQENNFYNSNYKIYDHTNKTKQITEYGNVNLQQEHSRLTNLKKSWDERIHKDWNEKLKRDLDQSRARANMFKKNTLGDLQKEVDDNFREAVTKCDIQSFTELFLQPVKPSREVIEWQYSLACSKFPKEVLKILTNDTTNPPRQHVINFGLVGMDRVFNSDSKLENINFLKEKADPDAIKLAILNTIKRDDNSSDWNIKILNTLVDGNKIKESSFFNAINDVPNSKYRYLQNKNSWVLNQYQNTFYEEYSNDDYNKSELQRALIKNQRQYAPEEFKYPVYPAKNTLIAKHHDDNNHDDTNDDEYKRALIESQKTHEEEVRKAKLTSQLANISISEKYNEYEALQKAMAESLKEHETKILNNNPVSQKKLADFFPAYGMITNNVTTQEAGVFIETIVPQFIKEMKSEDLKCNIECIQNEIELIDKEIIVFNKKEIRPKNESNRKTVLYGMKIKIEEKLRQQQFSSFNINPNKK